MMKLVVIIPAYNERATIGGVIREVPRRIPGVSGVRILVCDDGSNDGTAEAAELAGADTVIIRRRNRGLARTFQECLEAALRQGADVIVNTDADNHYDQTRIPELIEPILAGDADVVVGSRDLANLRHMSAVRKWGNRLANLVFTFLYGLPRGTDVSSGFRAYSREVALRLCITSSYTYTHETLIAVRDCGFTVANRVLPARDVTRPSRLMSSVPSHVFRAGSVAVTSFAVHRLFRMLALGAGVLIAIGLAAYIRFAFYYFGSGGAGHVQSLVIGSLLVVLGVQLLFAGFFAAALARNRRLSEEVLYRQRLLALTDSGRRFDGADGMPTSDATAVAGKLV